jgi:hypothetical protein
MPSADPSPDENGRYASIMAQATGELLTAGANPAMVVAVFAHSMVVVCELFGMTRPAVRKLFTELGETYEHELQQPGGLPS